MIWIYMITSPWRCLLVGKHIIFTSYCRIWYVWSLTCKLYIFKFCIYQYGIYQFLNARLLIVYRLKTPYLSMRLIDAICTEGGNGKSTQNAKLLLLPASHEGSWRLGTCEGINYSFDWSNVCSHLALQWA